MGMIVYVLCAATALGCAALLWRAYTRTGMRLLFWSAICFACLALNNALVAVDLVVFPDTNLFFMRNIAALTGVCVLLFALIRESR
jgi:hypothetical protein